MRARRNFPVGPVSHRPMRIFLGNCAALATVALLLGGSGTARAAVAKPVPPSFPHTLRAQPLNLAAAGPRAVMVAVASGYCSGDPFRPAIARVEVRWARLP